MKLYYMKDVSTEQLVSIDQDSGGYPTLSVKHIPYFDADRQRISIMLASYKSLNLLPESVEIRFIEI